MGGKRKILTQTRRKALEKEMMDALVAGTFTTNGRPLAEILDEVNTGIQEGRYPIEVDLPTLIGIWSGTPALTEAPAPAQPEPTNHGTVDQIQQAQAMAQQNVAAVPMVPQPSPAEYAATQYPVVQQPSPLAVAAGVAPGQMVPTALGPQPVQQLQPDNGAGYAIPEQYPVPQQHVAQPMTIQQAQQAMQAAASMEIGEPPKEEAVRVDAGPVADWLSLARDAQAKIEKLKDILEAAKANASAYADQIGGPDRSKILLLNGHPVMRRTFCVKNVTNTKRLAAEHPEIDLDSYKEPSSYYRTELV